MTRQQILDVLHNHIGDIQQRFDVKQLSLFGSAARDEMSEKSDIDVLVEFKGPATFDGYMGLKFYLADLFDKEVDLVTVSGLKPRARPHVEKDLIRVARSATRVAGDSGADLRTCTAEFAQNPPEIITGVTMRVDAARGLGICMPASKLTSSISPGLIPRSGVARRRVSNVCRNTSARVISIICPASMTWYC